MNTKEKVIYWFKKYQETRQRADGLPMDKNDWAIHNHATEMYLKYKKELENNPHKGLYI